MGLNSPCERGRQFFVTDDSGDMFIEINHRRQPYHKENFLRGVVERRCAKDVRTFSLTGFWPRNLVETQLTDHMLFARRQCILNVSCITCSLTAWQTPSGDVLHEARLTFMADGMSRYVRTWRIRMGEILLHRLSVVVGHPAEVKHSSFMTLSKKINGGEQR